jgi:hypothetical protein
MQAPYVPPVAAYSQEMDDDPEEERGGFNAAFDVRRLHAAARAKAAAVGEVGFRGQQPEAHADDMHGYADRGMQQEPPSSEEAEHPSHNRQVCRVFPSLLFFFIFLGPFWCFFQMIFVCASNNLTVTAKVVVHEGLCRKSYQPRDPQSHTKLRRG